MKGYIYLWVLIVHTILKASAFENVSFVVKNYQINNNHRLCKTKVLATQDEQVLIHFLDNLSPMIVYQNSLDLILPEALFLNYTTKLLPEFKKLKSFESDCISNNCAIMFILHDSKKIEEKKIYKRYLRWIGKFYKKNQDKNIFILQIKTQIPRFNAPLHQFTWMLNCSISSKQDSLSVTAAQARSPCLDHTLCYF